MKFQTIIAKLQNTYGDAEAPVTRDPFELVLWENVAYLAGDEARLAAFRALKKEIGVRPVEIMTASIESLTKICRIGGGIQPETRARRIKECAQIALNEFHGDVSGVLNLSSAKAIKALRQFPAIGEPGAEKILLFGKSIQYLLWNRMDSEYYCVWALARRRKVTLLPISPQKLLWRKKARTVVTS